MRAISDKTMNELVEGFIRTYIPQEQEGEMSPSKELVVRRIKGHLLFSELVSKNKIYCDPPISQFKSFDINKKIAIEIRGTNISFEESGDIFPSDELTANIMLAIECAPRD